MPTLITTPGGATSNSYATQAEANTYFDERLPLATPWVASGDTAIRALIMATRVLDAFAQPFKYLVTTPSGPAFIRTRRTWTGIPASATQRLAWPRVGMFDANGNPIGTGVIPSTLKNAQAELAGQLIMADTTLDNSVIAGGISSVSAGSVSVSFKDMIEARVLPDAVWNLMPPSWFTDEIYEPALRAQLDVVS